ncbi:putative maintenance of ploidy protein mob2 [Podospora australis]|uniref:Maintenance of ploidy protein mob2 n=1 Tax=Podospora australis TaxID=1536484 RepID=A0AAN6WQ72_9PEZI|nr:putative maintenance of ploidy protein mob2 [Podospora australis]
MSNLFSGINARFRGQRSPNSPGPGGEQLQPPSASSSPIEPPEGRQSSISSLAVKLPPLPSSPSLAETIGMDQSSGMIPSAEEVLASYHLPPVKPLWLNCNYAKHIVKGNFLTLSAKPKTVEMGEWVAHQVVDHWRMLITFIRLVHDKEEDGTSICNSRRCPKMSAGANHSFTWLNSRLQPVEIPAYEYLTLVQRYISGKIDDSNIFPTDASGVSFADNPAFCSPLPDSGQDWIGKRSGFPQNFMETCQTIFRQMFRVYAHLYWSHFDDLFCLNLEKSMNSCFSHFILTATTLNLLKKADLEPMQPLIDLWAALGTFPQGSKAFEIANLAVGQSLVQKAGGPPAS